MKGTCKTCRYRSEFEGTYKHFKECDNNEMKRRLFARDDLHEVEFRYDFGCMFWAKQLKQGGSRDKGSR